MYVYWEFQLGIPIKYVLNYLIDIKDIAWCTLQFKNIQLQVSIYVYY